MARIYIYIASEYMARGKILLIMSLYAVFLH